MIQQPAMEPLTSSRPPVEGFSDHRVVALNEKMIREIGALLADAAGPSRVILFGSHARGDAGEKSDLDLLVVEPVVRDRLREITRLRQVLRPLRIPVDLLVCSTAELEERRNVPTGAIYWALREGRIIHDSLG